MNSAPEDYEIKIKWSRADDSPQWVYGVTPQEDGFLISLSRCYDIPYRRISHILIGNHYATNSRDHSGGG